MELYHKLRMELREREVDRKWLQKKIGLHPTTISSRMTGKSDFELGEAYAILDALELPRSEIYTYFPPGGKSERKKPWLYEDER